LIFTTPPICNRFGVLHGQMGFYTHDDLGRGFNQVAVRKCRKDFDAFALQNLYD